MTKRRRQTGTVQDWSHFIIQNTPSGVITLDSQGRVTEFNPAAETLTGYRREEALGRGCEEILPCETQEQDRCPIESVVHYRKRLTQELLLENRSGGKTPIMLNAFPLQIDKGDILGGVIIIQDLTSIKAWERERRHLVNMFAHDLKTPVVGMAGLLRRLLDGKVGPVPQEQKVYLETINREMGQLESLIGKFLEFARLDLRILTPQTSAIQVEKECQEVLTLLRPLAEARDMEVEAEFPQEVLILSADPLLFRRVLENLVENAIKFGPPQSKIILEVRKKGREAQFAVKDQGAGIAPEDLPHLFDFFYRGAGAAGQKGFGLGLATVKRIIDAHGGRVWVDTGPDKGTTFYFTLPLETPEA